jgi:hypothetical protein
VCKPGGVVAVADLLSPADPERATSMNGVERLRDPSHVRALSRDELVALFPAAGLATSDIIDYEHPVELESWLARSFPDPAHVEEIRRRFIASLDDDHLGLATHRNGGAIRFRYEAVLCVSRKPA